MMDWLLNTALIAYILDSDTTKGDIFLSCVTTYVRINHMKRHMAHGNTTFICVLKVDLTYLHPYIYIFHSGLVIYNIHVISLVDNVKKVISNAQIETQI